MFLGHGGKLWWEIRMPLLVFIVLPVELGVSLICSLGSTAH